jgi:type VI secretion system protein VasJ
VAGANASGADLTYDPRFERLLVEVDKLSSVTGGRPDWHVVGDGEELLLATKDLRLAAWLTLAKTHLRGWEGLSDSLTGMKALVETHWNAMFPPIARLRARANAIEWLWTQLPSVVRSLPVNAADAVACDAAEAALSSVVTELEGKLGTAMPSARDVRNALSERQRDVPRAAPAPPVAATPASQSAAQPPPAAPAATPAAPPPAPEVATIDAALDVARAWSDPLIALARQARRANPAHGWSYRLVRLGAWLTVEELPEVETADRTYMRAPRPTDQERLAELLSRGEWAELVDASEEALIESPLWLDVGRFSAFGLERLGHDAARAAVVRETVALVRRFPRLVDLKFSNGSPLASPETSVWLMRESTSNGTSKHASGSSEVDLSFLDEARTRIAAGDITGAVSDALRSARERPSASERLLAETRVAELMLHSNEIAIGRAIAEALLEHIDPVTEAWAPDAVGLCYEVFINADRISAKTEERAPDPRVEALLKRMLRFAPESALRLWQNAR